MRRWPGWWVWDVELTPHVLKRMEDRGFTEVDLRRMIDGARDLKPDILRGRWQVLTRLGRRRWVVIVEPDVAKQVVVIVTAYPSGE
jgi:hypothetical protein